MSSLNQIISEIAHITNQADSIPVRRAIKLSIIHARNELIRHSYQNHGYVDKDLQQRFKVELIDVKDGDLYNTENVKLDVIKRTKNKVPRPTRFANNLPFLSVRTAGVENPMEIAFVREASSSFYKYIPGWCNRITYDYINDYIYINTVGANCMNNVNSIIIESVFEYPHTIVTETSDDGILDLDSVSDDDEYFIPEDMVNSIKKLVLETFNPSSIRDDNEVPLEHKGI